ncbi:class I SAM-dependent methyltransferase [Pseudoalteromonas sp. T1lg48]|uniref:class I SAM-dependent methyltransferase n=1 Tax=Pseudoalteromonas sp. T1lg48 TaxID=2077100 RepID=UPI000CF72732|nr:class I SAM-dependent methyltransferase [Pseudoalteromonas sp. T1lg48]
MSDHWTNYWEQGHLTSFGGGFKNNYEGELKEFWSTFASQLVPNSKVLDIGTGNGALIELIQKNNNFKCVGIDQATINNEISRTINGEFYSKVSAEKLIFSDNEFDSVIAQFALEYTNIDQSLDEVLRVLTAKGRFAFVCHHPESIVVKPNELILEAAKLVKSHFSIPLSNLIEAILDKDTVATRQFIKEIEVQITTQFGSNSEPLLGTNLPAFIGFLSQNSQKNLDFRKALSLFMSELELLILRLTELVEAAKNSKILIDRVKSLAESYEEANLYENTTENLIATCIVGQLSCQ